MQKLTDFLGAWRLTRRIDDRLAGAEGAFTGMAVFEAAGEGLLYREVGTLTFGAQSFQAERVYHWRAQGPDIRVDFEDGRFFHAFDPSQTAPRAHHFCAPDDYNVSYAFAAWPDWTATWAVKGPRKDYTSVTRYTRETPV